jgi:formate dehydrogenase major subunit
MKEQLNVIINGILVKGNPGEYVLTVAQRNNIEIPTLCNDPRLAPYSSCYLCVVEVEGMRGLQPACSTRITEGMKVNTDNEKIRKSRKTALDLIMSNHYADCAAPCKQTCPAGVDVQGYISLIEKGMYHEAVALIKETNPLPAICGRVCVRPCEVACRRNLLDEGAAVGIDYLKRFASDQDIDSPEKYVPVIKPATGKKVAVIGAGPGGLAAAFFLQKEGHQADIYEASPKAGGWLRYGIPEYRLPNDLLQKEVDNITQLGAQIFYNNTFGVTTSYDEIRKKYDATILAIGCQKGTSIGCEGDDAENVISGIDFLKEMELSGEKYNFKGKTIAVIGGGNTAMDCCRTSIRCGAEKVYVIYRRTEKEMPANPIEIHESKIEGVEYMFLTAPVKVNKDEQGKLKSLTCIKMGLGEPDASGRRRPVPIEGSETEIFMDYALAAIGQKTQADFIDHVNQFSDKGKIQTNKWGDLDVNATTLQSGIENIFACGDAVTGAATLIQAVGQAKIATRSCMQYLDGKAIEPLPAEFLSKKDNFKVQQKEDYKGKFENQKRREMPVLAEDQRNNFAEVELGYENDSVAHHETQRCLECGCAEYFTCDLKKYATQYGAEQNKYKGEFIEYAVDFRHPYIEIDNNKCILCSRCVRICKDVVGANALGLVNRGFKTYVAPSMGDSLKDTPCESCGMCISTCPTGAITENFKFKPGPVKLETIESICNYCSIGCAIKIHHHKGYVMKVTGANGLVNKDGNICRLAKFGYAYLNDSSRILTPMMKKNGTFVPVSYEEAYRVIAEKVKATLPAENAVFAGVRLTNEELFAAKKWANDVIKTPYFSNFFYMGRNPETPRFSLQNLPFDEIKNTSRIFIVGCELNYEHPVLGYMVRQSGIPVELITTKDQHRAEHWATKKLSIAQYYWFFKAVNHYIISHHLQNEMFLKDHVADVEKYKAAVLTENYSDLIRNAGTDELAVQSFAENFNKELNAVILFSEMHADFNTAAEIKNLVLLTGKLGKTAQGMIALQGKNKSQGLKDIMPAVPAENDLKEAINAGQIKNYFIFGEDPAGTSFDAGDVKRWLENAGFVVVQDYFMTDTSVMADLILPASMPFETGGTFTNTQRFVQSIAPAKSGKKIPEQNSLQQLKGVSALLNAKISEDASEIFSELVNFVKETPTEDYQLRYTGFAPSSMNFRFGGDVLIKRFNEEFNNNFK